MLYGTFRAMKAKDRGCFGERCGATGESGVIRVGCHAGEGVVGVRVWPNGFRGERAPSCLNGRYARTRRGSLLKPSRMGRWPPTKPRHNHARCGTPSSSRSTSIRTPRPHTASLPCSRSTVRSSESRKLPAASSESTGTAWRRFGCAYSSRTTASMAASSSASMVQSLSERRR